DGGEQPLGVELLDDDGPGCRPDAPEPDRRPPAAAGVAAAAGGGGAGALRPADRLEEVWADRRVGAGVGGVDAGAVEVEHLVADHDVLPQRDGPVLGDD